MTTKQGNPITHNNNQLITATGAKGTGKTTFMCEFLKPSEIGLTVYVDNENSGNRFRQQINDDGLDFGQYINTMERFTKLPSDDDLLDRITNGKVPWASDTEKHTLIDFFKYFMREVSQIPRNKYKSFVIDTGEHVEAGMAAYVDVNKKQFGVTNDWTLWTMGVYPLYRFILQGIWDRGIPNILIGFHIKDAAEGWGKSYRKIPGKVKPSGKPILKQLSSLMVWLVNDSRNPNGEPAALTLKERMGITKANRERDEWDNRTMIPKRIPTCTWEEIRRYLKEGYNISNPKSTEIPSDGEMDMISELLNDAQTRLMIEEAKVEQQDQLIMLAESGLLPSSAIVEPIKISGDESAAPKTKAEAIIRWKSVGRPLPELLRKFRKRGVTDENLAEHWEGIVTGQEE